MTLTMRDQLAAAQIRREDGKSGSRYVLAAGDAEAEMTFSRVSPHLVIIDHTEVPDAFRGMGAGLLLANLPLRMRAKAAGRSCRFARFFTRRRTDTAIGLTSSRLDGHLVNHNRMLNGNPSTGSGGVQV